MRAHHYELRWGVIGTAALVLVLALIARFQARRAAQLADLSTRSDAVATMRVDLLVASDAELRAVTAVDAAEAARCVSQARAAMGSFAAQRATLGKALAGHEQALLAQLDRAVGEYARIDNEVLALAARDTNGRAYSLAYGSAKEALDQADHALAVIIGDASQLAPARGREVATRAAAAQAALLRIAVLLPAHIAEAEDGKMDELEDEMADQQASASGALDAVAPLLPDSLANTMQRARAGYERFMVLRGQIVTLSRENTNVRALALVREKHNALVGCLEALDALARAAREEADSATKQVRAR
jgi:hypothetical protein